MKSLNQIRAALMEAAQDTEAHFVQPTEAQHSIGPMRRQDKEEFKREEGGDEEIGPGTQLRTSDGVYCEIDELDASHMTNRATRNRSHTDPLAGIEDYIKDYRESEDPRFEGKSKAERIKMAVSDFYKANPEKNEGAIAESMDGGHQAEEISMTRLELDEIADMADDLFHVLPNFDEVPAWVQHKIAAMHAGLHSIYDYYRLKGIERDQCSKGGLEVITIATPQNPVVQPAPVSPAPMD